MAQSLPPSYQPLAPFSAVASSTLSHDIVLTSNIIVDSQSQNPVGMIINPSSKGIDGNEQVEALAIITQDTNNNSTVQLSHVARVSNNESGWAVNPLFSDIQPVEVASGTNRTGTSFATIFGFFTDEKNLYYTFLNADGTSWGAYTTVDTNISGNSGIVNMSVTYTPLGTMILYGKTNEGNLITVYPQVSLSEPPTVNVCDLQGALLSSSFQLCMTDESTWYLIVNVSNQPVLYIGTLSATTPEDSQPVGTIVRSIQEVILSYWSHFNVDQLASAIWLFVDTNQQLKIWSMGMSDQTSPSKCHSLSLCCGRQLVHQCREYQCGLSYQKHWLGAFKTNLEVALSKQDRANGRFVPISSVSLAVGVPREVYIRSVAVPVLVCKDRTGGPVLSNKDGSVGELLLLTTDTTLSYQQL